MKHLLVSLLALTLAAGCQAGTPPVAPVASAGPATDSPFGFPGAGVAPAAPGQAAPPVAVTSLIVDLKPGATREQFEAAPEAEGFLVRGALKLGSRWLLEVALPAGVSVEAGIDRLSDIAVVQRVVPNSTARTNAYAFTQRDPMLDEQWYHQAAFCDTESAWALVPPDRQASSVLAVLDTGLDVAHEEFVGRVIGTVNASVAIDDHDVTDFDGHGTMVTSVAAATGDNGVGVAGVAWGVKILAIKGSSPDGGFSAFSILRGFKAAKDFRGPNGERVHVLNCSFGSPSGAADYLQEEAIADLREAGVLTVVSAGNDGSPTIGSVSASRYAVVVGATMRHLGWESLTAYSNYGPRLVVTAPGDNIMHANSSAVGNDFGAYAHTLLGGTSSAAPYVSGVAALIAAKYDPDNQRMDAAWVDAVTRRLTQAVDDLGDPGKDPYFGYGRINARKAVTPETLEADVAQ